MTSFRADLGALDELVARLRTFERGAESLCDEVTAQVARLHGEWSGPAAAEHEAAHRQWAEGAARMRSAVVALQAVVATAQANYAASGTANARMWG